LKQAKFFRAIENVETLHYQYWSELLAKIISIISRILGEIEPLVIDWVGEVDLTSSFF